eukprot:350515_1
MSSGLQLKNTFISFPYINSDNTSNNLVNRLLVDIEEEKSSCITVSLKYAYREYYPEYSQYLKQQKMNILYNDIYNYCDTIIRTSIQYKYRIGEFGYLNNGDTLERSFIQITDISKIKKELFFLHSDIYLYQYRHYDITSTTTKLLQDSTLPNSGKNNWLKPSEFIVIQNCVEAVNKVTELLNWKICREDYLTKTLEQKKKYKTFIGIESKDDVITTTTDFYNSMSGYTSTDSDSIRNNSFCNLSNYSIINITHSPSENTLNSHNKLPLPTILENHGYIKDKDFTQTLKGEIFIAVNINNINIEQPVAIKQMCNQNIIISEKKMDLVRETLILRNLKTRNSLVRDSIVNYIDLFQCKSNFYVVMELNFSVTLKEFVLQSLEYIKKGQLQLKHYRETIKYLLWRIITAVHWLHTDTKMNCSDLDLCPENIMLSHAEFIRNKNNNNLLEINLQIEMKLIDVGVREIVEIGAKEELKKFEYMYNIKYLSENNQYILPNNNILLDDPQTYDIWAYGMVVYFCFLGKFPYKKIPNTDDIA